MLAVDIIRRKRDGLVLPREAIHAFIDGVCRGRIADYQASAFLMAVVLRGMTSEETRWLTEAMLQSGERLDLSGLPGAKADKHSTGGVGDKTSLVIAPLAAACGLLVPMMSGRALGHTGGTLDKLEAIPGFRVELSQDEVREALRTVGCALFGQTDRIVPADRRLYALRDVTATVESVPLICASIMSKKIAEGIEALVLDVKAGSGAFMPSIAEARSLARALVDLGVAFGVRTEALVTAMDAPLGRAVGNALEVGEAIATLQGRGPADLEVLALELSARMLVLGGAAASPGEAAARVRRALQGGEALERLGAIIARQGGDARVVERSDRLPRAPYRAVIPAPREGWLTRLDAKLIGRASMRLGAGRARAGDPVDPSAGLVLHAVPGDRVHAGDPLVELHYRTEALRREAEEMVAAAVLIADEPPEHRPVVLEAVV